MNIAQMIDRHREDLAERRRRWVFEGIQRKEIERAVLGPSAFDELPVLTLGDDAMPARIVLALADLSSERYFRPGAYSALKPWVSRVDAFIADMGLSTQEPWCGIRAEWLAQQARLRAGRTGEVKAAWREAGLLDEEPKR